MARGISGSPRNVRNFWVSVEVDGRTTNVQTGPSAKDGGFNITIHMRDKGNIIHPVSIKGRSDGETLTLEVESRLPNCPDVRKSNTNEEVKEVYCTNLRWHSER
jgi:hypothetical protein